MKRRRNGISRFAKILSIVNQANRASTTVREPSEEYCANVFIATNPSLQAGKSPRNTAPTYSYYTIIEVQPAIIDNRASVNPKISKDIEPKYSYPPTSELRPSNNKWKRVRSSNSGRILVNPSESGEEAILLLPPEENLKKQAPIPNNPSGKRNNQQNVYQQQFKSIERRRSKFITPSRILIERFYQSSNNLLSPPILIQPLNHRNRQDCFQQIKERSHQLFDSK